MRLPVELFCLILLCGQASARQAVTTEGNTKVMESDTGNGKNSAQPATLDALLVGKWRHIDLSKVVDGVRLAPLPSDGNSVAEYKSDGTWQLVSKETRSAGTYRWINTTQIEQTVVESDLPIQRGLVSIKTVIVDQQRLELSIAQNAADIAKVLPPPKPGVHRQNVTMIITRFDRIAQ